MASWPCSVPALLSAGELMEHPFYALPIRQRRIFTIKVVAILLCSVSALVTVGVLTEAYWLCVLLPVPILQIAAPFLDTPSAKASGRLVYYSPLFIAEPTRGGAVILHGGTLFDYWFVFGEGQSAQERRRLVLLDYVRGLRRLAHAHLDDGAATFEIRATTYFLSPRTARKIGFSEARTDWGHAAMLWANAIPVMLAYSLVQRRLRVPPLHRVHTFVTPVEGLVENLPYLERLETRLAWRETERQIGTAPDPSTR